MRFATLFLGAFAAIAAAAPVPAEQTEASPDHANPILPIFPAFGGLGFGIANTAANVAGATASIVGAGIRGGRDLIDRVGDRIDNLLGYNDPNVVYVYGPPNGYAAGPPPPGYYAGPPPAGYYGPGY